MLEKPQEGFYWIRYKEFDGVIGDWDIGYFDGTAWSTVGTEIQTSHKDVVVVGPSITLPKGL